VKQGTRSGTWIVIWLLVIGVGLLLMLLFYVPPLIERVKTPAPTPPTTLVTPPEDPRYGIARDFVRAKLISPDAAQFPSGPDAYHLTSLGPDRYQVSSSVSVHFTDGEIVKRWFTVTMRYIGSGRYVLDGKGVELFEEGSKKLRQE
jgi:hypothetical protein